MSHSRQTEYYELPLYDGSDIINPLTDFNNANEAIDEALYNANERSVEAENTAGEAKVIAEGYEARVTQALNTANDAMTLAGNTQDMIAEDFDPNKAGGYNVGDFVIYNGKLYRFINAHTGAWDASDVQVSPVLIEAIADVVDEGKQEIADAVEDAEQEIAGQTEKVTKTQAMIAPPFDVNKDGGYAIGDAVTYADKLYKFTSAHSGAWTGLDVEQWIVSEDIADMKVNFQDGVDTIYDAIVAQGVTPSASTPSACAEGIEDITEIQWDEPFKLDLTPPSSYGGNTLMVCELSTDNIVSLTPVSSSGIGGSALDAGFAFYDGSGSIIGSQYNDPNTSGSNKFAFNTAYSIPSNCKKIKFLYRHLSTGQWVANYSIKRQTKILH